MAQKQRQNKDALNRARLFQAKKTLHEEQTARKRKDSVLALAIAVILIVISGGAVTTAYALRSGSTVTASDSASASASEGTNTGDVPSSTIAENRTWNGTFSLNGQTLDFSLDGAAAPQAVSSFIYLIQSGFYEGLTCHRLVDQDSFHILQCGDPNGDGSGGPSYRFGPIENAPSDQVYQEGVLAMARQSGDAYSNGSQFFIVFGDTTIANDAVGGYTVFGKITAGLDIVKQIAAAGLASGTDSTPAEKVVMSGFTVQ